MALFIGNTSNVFELYALLGFALGTFALMFFGMVIEYVSVNERPAFAIVLLYLPSFALFTFTWLPPIRQIFTDIFKLSCQTWMTDNLFDCTKSTCFGAEVPIPTFIFVLLLLFLIFPLIALIKLFIIGGWSKRWFGVVSRCLRTVCFAKQHKVLRIIATVTTYLIHIDAFLFFVLIYGWVYAIIRVVSDVLWPIFPKSCLEETTVNARDRWKGIIIGEYLYATASLTSKLFLLIYFLTTFGQRDW